MPKTEITATVETITPKVAEQYLATNDNNRSLRDPVINAYARDITAGHWRESGESIKFSTSGRLIDGQHRLHAVVRAKRNVKMLVVRGLDDGVQDVLDSGAARRAADALRMRGEAEYALLAAAARMSMDYTSGNADARKAKPTHAEIVEWLARNPDLRPAVARAATLRGSIDMPPTIVAVAYWRLAQIDAEACELFFKSLADKTGLQRGDAVLALLNRLIDIRRHGRRASRTDYLSLLFRAWNHWRQGSVVMTLPMVRQGESLDVPQPK